ncbi:hypothetical protein ETA_08350 [Erwinia tasmaniensis Et1/99]|uniref:Uncharacterized protein n=1 Tax=Erwinia tasmaniensis (strain DSM 17950 / CFBP 7177 / CIP 109463 / NCPPB 4357 / Et1/99) TaxID=465817 RepID=B2VD25_ERWT9|nr:hypothetical protein ETA_08350 [Erwinia tasmaniensis Et1/99]
MNVLGSMESIRLMFLSCLCGSEQLVMLWAASTMFLSCLCGSELF